MRNTSPGTTLGELGFTRIEPTVATASGACARAMASTFSTSRAAPSSAFLRRCMGVAPVWASWPVIVTSNQRMPCTPVTAPMSRPSASRIGPCSMCSSKNAESGWSPQRSLPRSPMASSAAPKLTPSASVRLTGPVAREHAGEHAGGRIGGQNRAPSSLVQFTSSMGANVS